ncbi:MAG TPA: ribosome biogenesis factor YjgA [Gammaproteobacteria bacterium]|nr:ribosome biogenesis factor YjgA [Gammaproteobacteria bacterium]
MIEDGPELASQAPAPSRTQRKREAEALQRLGERLVWLTPEALDGLEITPRLRDAVVEARRLTARGARQRQLRRIGRLMGEEDVTAIREALDRHEPDSPAARRVQKAAEQWRTQLLEQGDSAVTAFIDAQPHADVQALRRLVRKTRRDSGGNGGRELLRLIRSVLADR